MNRWTISLCAVAALLLMATPSQACTTPKLVIDVLWLVDNGFEPTTGKRNLRIGIEADLFPPTAPTTCIAGLGIQGPTIPSLQVTNVEIAVADPTTGFNQPLAPFQNLQRNQVLDPQIANQAQNQTQSNPVTIPTDTSWYGFGGLVDPFVPDPLPGGHVYKLWFDLLVDSADEAALLTREAYFAAGSTDPLHPIVFGPDITLSNSNIIGEAGQHDDNGVPEPMTGGLALVGGVALLSRRRRAAMAE